MLPLVLEFGVAIAIITGLVKTTSTINNIQSEQRLKHAEVLGKLDLQNSKLDWLETQIIELKTDTKDFRRRRSTDSDTGFN